MYCSNCGSEVKEGQAICLNCGFALRNTSNKTVNGEVEGWWGTTNTKGSKRGVSFVWAWFLGPFGAHRLYLGSDYRILMLLLGLAAIPTMGLTLMVTAVWTIIDLIRIGTASPEEFDTLFSSKTTKEAL